MRLQLIAASLVLAALPARAAEICSNGLDDDNDGLADEGCAPYLVTNQCPSPLACNEGMVSPSTGNLRYALPPDIAPRVPFGPSISFTRFLVSTATPPPIPYRRPMGARWANNYMSWLDKLILPDPDQVMLHLPTGQDVLFTYSALISTLLWDHFKPQPGFHFQYLRQRKASPNEYELKMLSGEVLVYSADGKLIEIRDSLATPNKVLLAYNATGLLSTVSDASSKRRLAFSYAPVTNLLTSVAFQTDAAGTGTWTTQHTTTYGFSGTNLTTVTIGGQLAQTNVYDLAGNIT